MFQALLHGLSKGAMGALTKGSIKSAIGQGIGSLGNMYATARVSGFANKAYAKASGIDPALTGASYINSPQLQRLSNDPVQSQKELIQFQTNEAIRKEATLQDLASQKKQKEQDALVENLTGITLGKNLGNMIGNVLYPNSKGNVVKMKDYEVKPKRRIWRHKSYNRYSYRPY